MHINNEIGTMQPVEEIGRICAKKQAEPGQGLAEQAVEKISQTTNRSVFLVQFCILLVFLASDCWANPFAYIAWICQCLYLQRRNPVKRMLSDMSRGFEGVFSHRCGSECWQGELKHGT